MSKVIKPIDDLIFHTAVRFAAEWAEAAFATPGLTRGKYVGAGDKPVKMFAKDHFEKFIPLVVSYFIEMLKPTSNCTPAMRETIYNALMNPINDPQLMEDGKTKTQNEHKDLIQKAIKNYDKRAIKFDVAPTNVLQNQTIDAMIEKKDLKGSTSLN